MPGLSLGCHQIQEEPRDEYYISLKHNRERSLVIAEEFKKKNVLEVVVKGWSRNLGIEEVGTNARIKGSEDRGWSETACYGIPNHPPVNWLLVDEHIDVLKEDLNTNERVGVMIGRDFCGALEEMFGRDKVIEGIADFLYIPLSRIYSPENARDQSIVVYKHILDRVVGHDFPKDNVLSSFGSDRPKGIFKLPFENYGIVLSTIDEEVRTGTHKDNIYSPLNFDEMGEVVDYVVAGFLLKNRDRVLRNLGERGLIE